MLVEVTATNSFMVSRAVVTPRVHNKMGVRVAFDYRAYTAISRLMLAVRQPDNLEFLSYQVDGPLIDNSSGLYNGMKQNIRTGGGPMGCDLFRLVV